MKTLTATQSRLAKISLCMIVRNEECHLKQCLVSAHGLADEIVVVDTGSTDQTKAIAQDLGARLVEVPWKDDFSAARNASIDAANGDWIFWLDADDRISDQNRMRLTELFQTLPTNGNAAYLFEYSCLIDRSSQKRMRVDQVRLFPRLPELRWAHRVHEQILPAIRKVGGQFRKTDIVIEHLGYEDEAVRSRKNDRNLRLLQIEIAETPTNAFTRFNYGWTLSVLGRFVEAIPHLAAVVDTADHGEIQIPKAYSVLAQSLRSTGQFQRAFDTCKTGRKRFPEDPELLFEEAQFCHQLGDFRRAAECLEELVRMNSHSHVMFGIDEGITGYLARHNLAVVYRDQGRLQDAEVEWRKVVNERPEMKDALLGLAEIVLVESRWLELEELCSRMDRLAAGRLDAAVLRARGFLGRREFARARQILEQVVNSEPKHIWPQEILSRVYLNEGNWLAAERTLKIILTLDPSHAAAAANLDRLVQERNAIALSQISNRPT